MDVTDPDEGQGIYTPLGASPLMSVAVRVRTNPLDHINNLRAALFEVDPALNVSRVVPLNKVNIEDVQATQVMSSSLAGIAVITMLLALAGIYSIVSLAVTQRTREIGVRVALGADKRQIVTSILRRSGTLIFAGAIVGAVLGALGGSVKMFVFTIPEQSLFLQPTMVLLVVVAGALACVVPTRRALRIQPVEALRYEE
jgi:ABC-type antimicrobial peptide transport system permease subunit